MRFANEDGGGGGVDEANALLSDLPTEAISSGKGTIRGKRHGVRAALKIITGREKMVEDDKLSRLYEQEKDGKIVLYTTSIQVVRNKHQLCKEIESIFYNLRLKVTRKDVSMDSNVGRGGGRLDNAHSLCQLLSPPPPSPHQVCG